MKHPERLLVTTLHPEHGATSTIWHTHEPLSLGYPFRWILESQGDTIRLRKLSGHWEAPSPGSAKEISLNEASLKHPLKLPLDGKSKNSRHQLSVYIQKLEDLPPPFKTALPSRREADHKGELAVFCCINDFVQKTIPVKKIEIVKDVYGTPIFAIRLIKIKGETQPEFEIQALAEGLVLHNGKEEKLPLKEKRTLKRLELLDYSLRLGEKRWHFTWISEQPVKLSDRVIALRKLNPRMEEKDGTFWKTLASLLGVVLLFLVISSLFPKTEKTVDEEVIPPQFAQIIMKQTPKAPAESQGSQGQQQPAVTKAKDAALVQAFRAQALQSAVSNLMKGGLTTLLAQSDLVSGRSNQQARNVFDAANKGAISTSQLNGLSDARAVQVSQLGGQATSTGVGYGKGERAGVAGQGSGYVGLDIGGASVEQGLTKEEVGKVIHAHMTEIRYCYESAMITNPSIEGKLMLDFTISASGKVSSTAVNESTTQSTKLDDCVIRRLVTWAFPLPKGGVNVAVSYPFIFKKLGR